MVAYSISIFRTALKQLKKSGHKTCSLDICNYLKDIGLKDIARTNPRISEDSPYEIFKIRLAESQSSKGRVAGFRLYLAITRDRKEVHLLYMYHKKGPDGKENISKQFLKVLIHTFAEERNSGDLVAMDVDKELILVLG